MRYYCFYKVFELSLSMSKSIKKVKDNIKDSQLLIRISSAERDQFVQLCDELDTSAAREIRRFIRQFIQHNKTHE